MNYSTLLLAAMVIVLLISPGCVDDEPDTGPGTVTLVIDFGDREPTQIGGGLPGNTTTWHPLKDGTWVSETENFSRTTWRFENVPVEDDTVGDLLDWAAEEFNFTIGSTYFSNVGSRYIESIAGVEEDGDRYWQFWYKGSLGSKGADLQGLKDGNIVEWRFVESQF